MLSKFIVNQINESCHKISATLKPLDLGESEVYFLLSAFANMAISRGLADKMFIERAA